MSVHVALLRAINVGGRNLVGMSDLRDMLTALGFGGVQSLLQSGNLVFDAPKQTGDPLERLLEIETAKRFGVTVDCLVRRTDEWKKLVARNPFTAEAEIDPGHLVVMFLKTAPQATDVKALQAAIKGREVVRADGKHLYAVYRDGIGQSKLTNALIEKTLRTRGTGRNWNTVLKLAAISAAEKT